MNHIDSKGSIKVFHFKAPDLSLTCCNYLQKINDENFIHWEEETRSQQDSQHYFLRYINFRFLLHNFFLRVGVGFFWGGGGGGGGVCLCWVFVCLFLNQCLSF